MSSRSSDKAWAAFGLTVSVAIAIATGFFVHIKSSQDRSPKKRVANRLRNPIYRHISSVRDSLPAADTNNFDSFYWLKTLDLATFMDGVQARRERDKTYRLRIILTRIGTKLNETEAADAVFETFVNGEWVPGIR